MDKYEALEMEIIELDATDILTTSGGEIPQKNEDGDTSWFGI